ncbi:MAG: hypothetical protein U0269_22005 [Polyangiales bacterium]
MKRTLFTALFWLAACGQPMQAPQDSATDVAAMDAANNEAAAPADAAMNADAAAPADDAQASDSGLTPHQECAAMGGDCAACCAQTERDGADEFFGGVYRSCGCGPGLPCNAQCADTVCRGLPQSTACGTCVSNQAANNASCATSAVAACTSAACTAFKACVTACPAR